MVNFMSAAITGVISFLVVVVGCSVIFIGTSFIGKNRRHKSRSYNADDYEDTTHTVPSWPIYTYHLGDSESDHLQDVDFVEETRAATITLIHRRRYRTIERYVQSNYVKTPIYSDEKVKETTIIKHIKLTNLVLEELNFNPDSLLAELSSGIIALMGMPHLRPSWYIEEYRRHALDIKLAEIMNYETALAAIDNEKTSILWDMKLLISSVNKINDWLALYKSKKSFYLMATIGIIGLVKKAKVRRKYRYNAQIELKEDQLYALKKDYAKKRKQLKDKKDEKKSLENEFENESIVKLPQQPISDKSFTPLIDFAGLNYKIIIGCYIIHNKETDRYYVGQSKDILKRLRQHFNGTIPSNYVFFEDYAASKVTDKSNIFEIKIIPLSTKDELDRTERELISIYQSNISGYNRTKGNK